MLRAERQETTPMKKLQRMFLIAVAAGAAQSAPALNYSSTDLLLVFRQDGQKDVEFDLGSVTNFLGQTAGSQTAVSYNKTLVLANFGGSLAGVKFAIAGTTSQTDPLPRVWLTDAKVSTPPAQLSGSAFGVLHDKIDSVGVSATYATVSNANPYAVSTSVSSSYDYLVTSGIGSAVSTFYGDAPSPVGSVVPLPVDAANPTTLAFYELRISGANPTPAASLIGAFTLDASGNLTFTAGTLPPLSASTITAINADPINTGSSSISFTTSNGLNYQLFYAPSLAGGWARVPGVQPAAGDGTVQTLTDDNSTDPIRFYRIKSTY